MAGEIKWRHKRYRRSSLRNETTEDAWNHLLATTIIHFEDKDDRFTAAVWFQEMVHPSSYWSTGRTENEALQNAAEIAKDFAERTAESEEDLESRLETLDGKVWPGRVGPFEGTEYGDTLPTPEEVRLIVSDRRYD